MALMRSKKKRPSREEYVLKERIKIGDIDERTAIFISKLMTKGIVDRVEHIIARGKESDIYLARSGNKVDKEFVALKIFRIENTNFLNRLDYIIGDPRFITVKKSMHYIVKVWCRKEYGNLKLADASGALVPKPYGFKGNVLALEYLGDENAPAPTLDQVNLENPKETYDIIIDNIRKLFKIGLVHSDLSQYNILYFNNKPYFIDFGQAVVIKHPKAYEYLERDIYNISKYFSKKYNIETDPSKIYNELISTQEP